MGINPGVCRYRDHSERALLLIQGPDQTRRNPKVMNLYRMKKERNNSRKGSSEALMIPSADGELDSRGRRGFARRSFLKRLGMAGATLLPASALLTTKVRANPGD